MRTWGCNLSPIDRRQPTSFTRHTCTQRGRGGSISYQTGNCVCQGQRCTAARMAPQQRIAQGASCDAHESWQRQQVGNDRGDEDWTAYNDRIVWWNSAHQTNACDPSPLPPPLHHHHYHHVTYARPRCLPALPARLLCLSCVGTTTRSVAAVDHRPWLALTRSRSPVVALACCLAIALSPPQTHVSSSIASTREEHSLYRRGPWSDSVSAEPLPAILHVKRLHRQRQTQPWLTKTFRLQGSFQKPLPVIARHFAASTNVAPYLVLLQICSVNSSCLSRMGLTPEWGAVLGAAWRASDVEDVPSSSNI